MKNKIILLLVLLIPSLSFGKSLRITAIHRLDNNFQLNFLDNTDAPNVIFSFTTKNNYIDLSKEDDFETLQALMMKHFPKDFPIVSKEYSVSKSNNKFFYMLFENCIMDLAVLNNYQITFTNRELKDSGFFIFTVFLYKPDK